MTARFIGGPSDGKSVTMTAPARICIVPTYPAQTATIEDFSLINLDHVWNGRPPPKPDRHRYRMTNYDPESDVATYTYDGKEER